MSVDEDVERVLEANHAFYAAFEMLSMEAMSRVWSSDAPVSCIHPRGDLVEGRADVLASWKAIFESTRSIHFNLKRVRAFVAGDAAWVVLFEDIETHHGEATLRAQTQATNIFVREGTEWKLVHHHAEPATSRRVQVPPPDTRLN
jgi:ketosteroid isomerase-like protein